VIAWNQKVISAHQSTDNVQSSYTKTVPHQVGGGSMTSKRQQSRTGSTIGRRGMSQQSRDLIEAMRAAAKIAKPITGRGIGYKLFVANLIASMATGEMAKVYRLLRIAREQGMIPWKWIVDETRELERAYTWDDPEEYAEATARGYRRDFWQTQPVDCIVGSEKGTVRGVLAPVLDELACTSNRWAGSAAQPSPATLRSITRASRWCCSTSATMTPAACSCRSAIYRTGSPSTAAIM